MRSRRLITVVSVVIVAAFALLAAGCGGGKSPGVASGVGGTTTTSTQTGTAAFARCMRSNGVPTFPDPVSSGEIPKVQVVAAAKSNPKFNAAQTACMHLLPNGSLGPEQTAAQKRTQLADELSFATCMRSHGVSHFPDPTAQGELSIAMVQAQGIDVHSPQVLRVVQACLPASHGGLTAKKVEEAINGSHG